MFIKYIKNASQYGEFKDNRQPVRRIDRQPSVNVGNLRTNASQYGEFMDNYQPIKEIIGQVRLF